MRRAPRSWRRRAVVAPMAWIEAAANFAAAEGGARLRAPVVACATLLGRGRQGHRRRVRLDHRAVGIEPERPYASASNQQRRRHNERRLHISVLEENPEDQG